MKLTGKEIHEMYAQSPLAWDDLPEQSRQAYDDVAAKINKAHIEPLQFLIVDIRNFMACRMPFLNRERLRKWEAERDALFLRVRDMLNVDK
jgi:hypothetical protein